MPEESAPQPPPAAPAAPVASVTIAPEVGSFGLRGVMKELGQTTAMVLMMGLFVYLFQQHTVQSRQDRVDDRQLFRESVRDIMQQADRHTGEVKAAMDANTAATRGLAEELRKAGHETRDKVRGTPVPPPED